MRRQRFPVEIYECLYEAYGPQGWWPVTLRAGSAPVYRPGIHLPENDRQRHEMIFGAILTQNTSWTNVQRALMALTEAGIRTPAAVLSLPLKRLEALIRPSGYFRQKARRLKVAARFFRDFRAGAHSATALREKLLALHGVGPETADSILLYALGHPVFVVDAYTRRISSRMGFVTSDISYNALQKRFAEALGPDVPVFNECHALLVALAKKHCSARPICRGCPLERCCDTGRKGA